MLDAMAGLRSVCVAIGIAAAAASARAQPDIEIGGDAPAPAGDEAPVKDPKVAKKWLAAAKELTAKGDALAKKKPDDAKTIYENAATAYGKAIEAGDDLTVHLALAAVEEKLGRIDAAARDYRIVATAKTGVPPAVIKQAQAKLDDASTKIGFVTFTVSPDGTTIANGAEKLGKTPLAEPLIFMPGSYTLTLSSDGYKSKDSEIKVEAGSESERKIDLEPVKMSVEKPPAVTSTDDNTPPVVATEPSKLPMLIGAGAGGAFLLATVVTGMTARSWHNTFVGVHTSADERQFAHDSGRHWARVSDVCLVGAVAAGGFAAAWYVLVYRKALATPAETPAREVPKVDMIPWVQPQAGGISLAGSF